MQLRPLKEHLQSLSGESLRQVEQATRAEHDKQKLHQRVRELETQLQTKEVENSELNNNYRQLVQDKNKLLQ